MWHSATHKLNSQCCLVLSGKHPLLQVSADVAHALNLSHAFILKKHLILVEKMPAIDIHANRSIKPIEIFSKAVSSKEKLIFLSAINGHILN